MKRLWSDGMVFEQYSQYFSFPRISNMPYGARAGPTDPGAGPLQQHPQHPRQPTVPGAQTRNYLFVDLFIFKFSYFNRNIFINNPPLREPRSGNFFPNSWVRPDHCNIVEFGFHPL